MRARERETGRREWVSFVYFNSIFIRFVSSNLEFLFAILVQLSVRLRLKLQHINIVRINNKKRSFYCSHNSTANIQTNSQYFLFYFHLFLHSHNFHIHIHEFSSACCLPACRLYSPKKKREKKEQQLFFVNESEYILKLKWKYKIRCGFRAIHFHFECLLYWLRIALRRFYRYFFYVLFLFHSPPQAHSHKVLSEFSRIKEKKFVFQKNQLRDFYFFSSIAIVFFFQSHSSRWSKKNFLLSFKCFPV